MICLPYPVTPVFAFARAVSPRLGMNGVRGRSSIFRESFLIQSSVDLAVLCLGCLPADPGNACFDWGAVVNPRTVGFRFKYVSQGSGIADGMSLPKDVTWLPLP
jgi:hypothetical protein